MSNQIFVSWISFHGRSDGIADALGMSKVNISTSSKFKPFGYVKAFFETRRAIRNSQPDSVFVMMPPFFALLAVVLLNFPKKYRIFADLHTGVFYDPKWKFALPATLFLLRKHSAIVTNSHLAKICQDAGIETYVLHDFIDDMSEENPEQSPGISSVFENLPDYGYALVPLAYEHDEPLQELLEAARLDPNTMWVLTGRAPDDFRLQAPDNIFFPGFVDNATFELLLRKAGCVCALTTKGETMQRAAYEGLSYGKSLVVSNQNVLAEYYEESASYTDNSASGIYASVKEALTQRIAYEALSSDLRKIKIQEQASALELIANSGKSSAIVSNGHANQVKKG